MPSPLTLNRKPAVVIALIYTVATFVGASFTGDYDSEWYRKLARPAILPPTLERAIPFIWGVIYVLTGVALAAILSANRGTAWKAVTLSLIAVQLVLNYSYSIVFTMHRDLPGALSVAAALSAVTAVLMLLCSAQRLWLPAACLLPYLCWSTFATYLTSEILRLNS